MEDRGPSFHLLWVGALIAGRIVRNFHGPEFFSLVHLLGAEPDSGLFPDQIVGWPVTHARRHAILRLYHGGQRDSAAGFPFHSPGDRQIRLHRFGRDGPQWHAGRRSVAKAWLV